MAAAGEIERQPDHFPMGHMLSWCVSALGLLEPVNFF
jgi:hypothetical protein